MSAKWRALQHRHRYTYSSVVFPSSFLRSLSALESASELSSPLRSRVLAGLRSIASLDTTYAQVAAAKDLANSFAELLASCAAAEPAPAVVKLYLEMLLVENSLPLHRPLISAIARSKSSPPLLEGCLISLCREHRRLGREGRKLFSVSRALLSFLSYPKLGFMDGILERCAVMAGLDVSAGIAMVAEDISLGSRPSPAVMEQCQDAMSCLYYLLQRYPSMFGSSDPKEEDEGDEEEGGQAWEAILEAISSVLKSSSFSRDCLVAAGVSFWAALQTRLTSQQLASFIAHGFFGVDGGESDRANLLPEIGEFSVLGRICLLRGMLAAVPRAVLTVRFIPADDPTPWMILYDGILPELCNFCENPIDSHFNFHVLTVLQICLQQIRTSIAGDMADPLPASLAARLLRIIWNNLEDPLNQTVKQVHLIFDLLIDINPEPFLSKTAAELLRLGPRCKGRYAPLVSLSRRLGALTLLEKNPRLMADCMHAYVEDDVCCAATSFLKSFLECLRDECWSSRGVELGYSAFRGLCLPPLMRGLLSGASKLRSNLTTYALPVVLEIDVDSVFLMLAFLSLGPDREERETLKAEAASGRQDAISRGKDAKLASTQFTDGALGEKKFLSLGLDHEERETQMVRNASRKMNCEQKDASFHCTHVIGKLEDGELSEKNFLSLGLDHEERETQKVGTASGRHDAKLLSTIQASDVFGKLEDGELGEKTSADTAGGQTVAALVSILKVSRQLSLVVGDVDLDGLSSSHAVLHVKDASVKVPVTWLVHALTHADENVRVDAAESLFLNPKTARLPSALELKLMRDVVPLNMRCSSTGFQMRWTSLFRKFFHRARTALERHAKHGDPDESQQAMDLLSFMRWLSSFLFSSCYSSAPYERKIMAMGLILTMLDAWPLVPASQGNAVALLPYANGFPSQKLTLSLVGSIVDSWDRIRESSFRILLHFISPLPGMSTHKLVGDVIVWAKKLVCSPRVRESDAGALTLRLLFRKYVVELGWVVSVSDDIICHDMIKNDATFSHYILSLINWLRIIVELGERDLAEACKNCFVHGVLLALRYTFEELDWNMIVNSPRGYSEMKTALEELLGLVMRITSLALWVVSADAWYLPEEMDDTVDEDAFISDKVNENDHVADQAVMVGCWLAMKEVSLLLGTIIRKVPLPGYDIPSDTMLNVDRLEAIGGHFLQVLLKMKHNGAIDKTRAGFTALCNRLLCSNVPRLCQMTESWMDELMERVAAKGQTVDDLLRRSAGIPAAFMALFLSEPEGAPKKLLPRALRWIIDLADKSPKGSNKSNLDANVPKVRDEGVIPTVHAFNILRAAFNDTNLAVDTSGFCAEALIISIRSFSSHFWEVRNSACLAFTALIRRMIGFLNVQKRESARRVLTGLEFFHRYPAVHHFLFNELKVAARFSVNRFSEKQLEIHPSLCPILILLSRLNPSLISSEANDPLDPFLFMSFIRLCATQSNLRIRILAARALTGLVSNEKLPTVIKTVALGLPSRADDMTVSFNFVHGMLMQLNSLVNSNCRNLKDDSKKDMVLGELIQDLRKCSWIGSFRSCPCPTLVSSYLTVLGHMLDIAMIGWNTAVEIKTLLLELSLECLEEGERSYGLMFFDPTVEEARKQAAGSFLQCFFSENTEVAEKISPRRFLEKLRTCISDPSSEVRIVTLKLLLKFVRFMANHSSLRVELQPMMIELLTLEENPRCIYYLLSILFSWNQSKFVRSSSNKDGNLMHIGVVDIDSVVSLWERLDFLVGSTGSGKIRAMLICCMGLCIRRFLELHTDPMRIDQFLLLVKKHSSPAEPVNLRRATADGIITSGLLQQALPFDVERGDSEKSLSLYGSRALEAWFICIQLLEDEDVGLRQKLAEDVQGCVALLYPSRWEILKESGPLQVERVIELSFDFLSSVFGNWVLYVDHLLRWVFSCGDHGLAQGGNLVRQVFDKEIDNHHEEKLLICQICCSHCERLISSPSFAAPPTSSEFLGKWRSRFMDRLISFSTEFLEGKGKEGWVGGVGNHKDAFLGIYGALLGLYTLSQSPHLPVTAGAEESKKLGRAVRPFLSNPLISRLYSLVNASLEGAPAFDQEDQQFDPYFLLR